MDAKVKHEQLVMMGGYAVSAATLLAAAMTAATRNAEHDISKKLLVAANAILDVQREITAASARNILEAARAQR